MKRLTIFILCLTAFAWCFAAERIYCERLHHQIGLHEDMKINEVVYILQIELSEFKTQFNISPDDQDAEQNTIAYYEIPLDDIYQFYSLKRYGYNDYSTVGEVCRLLKIPFNVMSKPLNLNAQDPNHKNATIREIHHEVLDIEDIKAEYNTNRLVFSSTLLLMGMSLVLIALIVIAFVISQIGFFGKVKKVEEKLPSVITSVGKVIAARPKDLVDHNIAAVIAAIHKLKTDTEEQDEVISSWRHVNINMWRASGKAEFPSVKHNLLRQINRGKK